MTTFFLHNSEIYGIMFDPSWMTLSPSNTITFNPAGGAVTSVVGNTGDVTLGELASAGVATTASVALLAPLASPALTGSPTAPTPLLTDNDTSIATTEYVTAKIASATAGVSTVVGNAGAVTLSQLVSGGVAPLDSPAFLGTPTLPSATTAATQSAGNATTAVATTAFVTSAVAAGAYTLPAATSGALGGVKPDGTTIANAAGVISVAYGTSATTAAQGNDSRITGALSTTTAAATYATIANLALKAPLASPTLTGVPAAPTAATSTNSTQIATTAFVVGQAGTASPVIDGTATVGTSLLYSRQDHVHPTDTSRSATTITPTGYGSTRAIVDIAGDLYGTSGTHMISGTTAARTDNSFSMFGGNFTVAGYGGENAVVGSTVNTTGGSIFPTGVTGYGKLTASAAGSQVFGIFGQADLHAAGVAVNELNSFNYAATPSGTLPPNTAFGTTDYVTNALQLVAYGNFASSLALYIARGSQPFQHGIYIAPASFQGTGLYVDADANVAGATSFGAIIKNYGIGVNLALQTTGPFVASNAVIQVTDAAATLHFSVKQNGDVSGNNVTFAAGSFGNLTESGTVSLGGTGITGNLSVSGNIANTTGSIQNNGFTLNASGLLTFRAATITTSATAGASSVLPSNPQGYITVQINGSMFKLPYYN